jgi:hypothetical protein
LNSAANYPRNDGFLDHICPLTIFPVISPPRGAPVCLAAEFPSHALARRTGKFETIINAC